MTPSKTLFYFCVSFIAGIALQSFIKIPHSWLWVFLLLGAVGITASFSLRVKKHSNILENVRMYFSVGGFCMLFLVLGILRLQITEFNIVTDPLATFRDQPGKITLIGKIISEPDVRDISQKLKIKVNGTESVILVTANRYPEYNYLEEVKLTGKLETPPVFPARAGGEDFNYRNYLLKDGVYSIMDYPKIEIVSQDARYNAITFSYAKLLAFKKKLNESINKYFLPVEGSIVEGVILGRTSSMSQDFKKKMSATGLTHLTAISGSNVVILSTILMSFLLFLGLWRGQAFYISLVFIWLYIIIAGFPASGIRAAIMGSIFLLAQKLGRQNTTSRVIIMAGALMLLQNPMLLIYDVGFQLSFLATMGIIYLKPFIDAIFRFDALPNWKFISKERLKYFLDIFSITIAAQIFTIPIIAYYFKNISLVAPITNLLIIPIVDWIMILGFLAALAGVFSGVLAFIVALPASLLLAYFVKVMDVFYRPWASVALPAIFWFWIALYYLALIALIHYLNRFLKPKFLGY